MPDALPPTLPEGLTRLFDAYTAEISRLTRDVSKVASVQSARAALDDALRELVSAADDDLEMAWVLIANASGSDWDRESPEWRAGAIRWRDKVMPGLSARAAARSQEATR